MSRRARRLYYDAWFLDPNLWNARYHRQVGRGQASPCQVQTCGGAKVEDQTRAKLGAALPGQVRGGDAYDKDVTRWT